VNFQARLEKILRGENTFRSLSEAYGKDPKNVATVFGLARKWWDRDEMAKAQDKFKEVIALDPEGKAGTFADEDDMKIMASYTDFARYELALATARLRRAEPDLAPVKAFIADSPKNPLVREAYRQLGNYYANAGPKGDAAQFFAEYASRYPDDPQPLSMWLGRILRDKDPLDKGAELAVKLRVLNAADPNPDVNLMLARFYDLTGDTSMADKVYGNAFVENHVQDAAYGLVSYAIYWVDKKENQESAMAMADAALRLEPGVLYFIRQAAYVHLTAGDSATALELYGPAWLAKNIDVLDPHDIRSYAMFWTRAKLNLESSLVAARKTVERQPKTYYFWSTLGDVYSALGKKAEAIKAAEKALELAPPNEKPAMQKKLDSLKAPTSPKVS
jgi:tetratricopeptide (TPR) repeat protein